VCKRCMPSRGRAMAGAAWPSHDRTMAVSWASSQPGG
jgi:hypothetical protein